MSEDEILVHAYWAKIFDKVMQEHALQKRTEVSLLKLNLTEKCLHLFLQIIK